MRVKQLAAIVEPRPWWAPFIRVSARISHYQLPVGAAAILALTFVTVREYRATNSGLGYPSDSSSLSVTAEVIPANVVTPAPVRLESPVPSETQVKSMPVVAKVAAPATPVLTGQVSHSVPLLDSTPPATEPTPSAKYIAANLAAARAADPRIGDGLFNNPTRPVMARQPVRDPLAQISSPGDSRRDRFITTALPAVATGADVPVNASDRAARRLTEDRLYDTISRVGLKGDRVAIKF